MIDAYCFVFCLEIPKFRSGIAVHEFWAFLLRKNWDALSGAAIRLGRFATGLLATLQATTCHAQKGTSCAAQPERSQSGTTASVSRKTSLCRLAYPCSPALLCKATDKSKLWSLLL